MTIALFANPGQTITLSVQVLDGYGARADGYQEPTVDFIRMPNGTFAAGYPSSMTIVETGVYIHSVTLPSGASGLGTYIVSATWPHPDTGMFQGELFMINVSLPFGNSSVSPA